MVEDEEGEEATGIIKGGGAHQHLEADVKIYTELVNVVRNVINYILHQTFKMGITPSHKLS